MIVLTLLFCNSECNLSQSLRLTLFTQLDNWNKFEEILSHNKVNPSNSSTSLDLNDFNKEASQLTPSDEVMLQSQPPVQLTKSSLISQPTPPVDEFKLSDNAVSKVNQRIYNILHLLNVKNNRSFIKVKDPIYKKIGDTINFYKKGISISYDIRKTKKTKNLKDLNSELKDIDINISLDNIPNSIKINDIFKLSEDDVIKSINHKLKKSIYDKFKKRKDMIQKLLEEEFPYLASSGDINLIYFNINEADAESKIDNWLKDDNIYMDQFNYKLSILNFTVQSKYLVSSMTDIMQLESSRLKYSQNKINQKMISNIINIIYSESILKSLVNKHFIKPYILSMLNLYNKECLSKLNNFLKKDEFFENITLKYNESDEIDRFDTKRLGDSEYFKQFFNTIKIRVGGSVSFKKPNYRLTSLTNKNFDKDSYSFQLEQSDSSKNLDGRYRDIYYLIRKQILRVSFNHYKQYLANLINSKKFYNKKTNQPIKIDISSIRFNDSVYNFRNLSVSELFNQSIKNTFKDFESQMGIIIKSNGCQDVVKKAFDIEDIIKNKLRFIPKN